jgi:hypothetical protein
MDWRCGSSGRVLALHLQSFEFKPQPHENKTEQSKTDKQQQNRKETF